MSLPPTYVLAEHLLGEPLHEWIAAQRKAGLSWRKTTRALWDATDQRIDVTYETVRTWARLAEPAK